MYILNLKSQDPSSSETITVIVYILSDPLNLYIICRHMCIYFRLSYSCEYIIYTIQFLAFFTPCTLCLFL